MERRSTRTNSEIRLSLGSLYEREAVLLAAQVFSDRAEFFVEPGGSGGLELTLQARAAAPREQLRLLAGEFLNETLSQDLRLRLARKESRLLQLLTAQALSAARGAGAEPGR